MDAGMGSIPDENASVKAQILCLMQQLSDEVAGSVIADTLALRPSLKRLVDVDSSGLSTHNTSSDTCISIAPTPHAVEIISTRPLLSLVKRDTNKMWTCLFSSITATSLCCAWFWGFKLRGIRNPPIDYLTEVVGAASMLVTLFVFYHWVNAELFWNFVCSFDFGIIAANVVRLTLAYEINERWLNGFSLAYVVELVPFLIMWFCTLAGMAAIDAVLVRDARLVLLKKVIVCFLLLGFSITFSILSVTDYYRWADAGGAELPLWFVLLAPKKHYLAGLSTVLIYTGKFAWNIVICNRDFAVKSFNVTAHYQRQIRDEQSSSMEMTGVQMKPSGESLL